MRFPLRRLLLRHVQPEAARIDLHLAVALHQRGVEEVHARAADEAGYEDVRRVVVQVLRRIDLLQHAVLHNRNARGHRHRLNLVVRHVDKGRRQALVQLGNLGPRLDAQLGVQVR